MDRTKINITFEIIQRIKKINIDTYIFISIILAAILVRCYEITVPYGKTWEIGFQELIAKNHYYYGFTQTHFLSVISVVDGVNIYHLAHPPLLQIIISLSYSLFGVHEWSARIVPIVFSVGSIILLYCITKKLYNARIALITAFFASFVPMSAYFGRIVNFEAPVLFFVLLVVWGYIQWVETNKERYFYVLLIGVFFGVLTDWPFLIILPILLGIAIITGKKIRAIAFLLVMGCVIASGYLIITNSIGGFTFSYFIQKLLHRSDVTSYISNTDFYYLISKRLLRNFTSILFLLTSVGIIYLIIEKNLKEKLSEKKIDMPTCISLGLLLFGLLYITVFLQSTYVHEWQMYYLIPGISIFSALGLYAILNFRPKNQVFLRLYTICGGIILIIFCILSASSLITMHEKNFDFYRIGILINNKTQSDDYIDFSNTINPTLYYANRTNIQYVALPPDIKLIKKYNPKFVGFLAQQTVDTPWNRSDFVKTLVDLNYTKTMNGPGFQVWSKNSTSIF